MGRLGATSRSIAHPDACSPVSVGWEAVVQPSCNSHALPVPVVCHSAPPAPPAKALQGKTPFVVSRSSSVRRPRQGCDATRGTQRAARPASVSPARSWNGASASAGQRGRAAQRWATRRAHEDDALLYMHAEGSVDMCHPSHASPVSAEWSSPRGRSMSPGMQRGASRLGRSEHGECRGPPKVEQGRVTDQARLPMGAGLRGGQGGSKDLSPRAERWRALFRKSPSSGAPSFFDLYPDLSTSGSGSGHAHLRLDEVVALADDQAAFQRMAGWLASLGMGRYAGPFARQGLTSLASLELLSEADLRDVGVDLRDRPLLLDAIQAFSRRTKRWADTALQEARSASPLPQRSGRASLILTPLMCVSRLAAARHRRGCGRPRRLPPLVEGPRRPPCSRPSTSATPALC
jgi:hypothetical protein